MKKLLLNTLLLSFMAFNGNAQRIMDTMDPNSSGALFRNNVLNKKDLAKIEGSEYLVDEFRLAEVSGIPQQIMVRYNAMTDMIEVQNEKKELFSLMKKDPFNIITIIPFTDKIKLLNYKTKEGEANGYLVELFNKNDVALYRRDRITLQKGKEAVNSYAAATPARYVKTSDEYYLSLKNETAIALPKNKKEFQDLFPMRKEEITAYLKKNNFSLKDEKSIIEMAKFIANF
ncbi:hypothetical protein E0I61_00695 [Flavobacterium ranwuense]|uniref:Uncharacterized protein n=1 Tax=Flavobacterium ranwuense TaxID=2541725 RepID=A0ABY2DU66_9FLAO|nr:hypothetical protein [Flavobacterium ranwuense]TDE31253.1 hypothetical protein E0I61_00695 [Flavobacterium ranwuense]